MAVEMLPLHTKRAMLEGIDNYSIIIGAYTDKDGGVCPMLAAHRCGGRTSFATFAKAWDRYTGAKNRSRPATEREIVTLTAMLEASLATDEGWDLGKVVEEHKAVRARIERELERELPNTGETDRSKELQARHGWSWMRPVRRYDDFQAALTWLEEAEQEIAERHRSGERELERV